MYPKWNGKGSSLSGKEKTITSKTLGKGNPRNKGKHVAKTAGQPLK